VSELRLEAGRDAEEDKENEGRLTVTAEASRPPTTTTEQDLRTAGQRRVNLIWEYSQAAIALLVVSANIINELATRFVPVVVSSDDGLLGNAFFLVIGFYFGRTNHARIGDDPRRGGSLDDR